MSVRNTIISNLTTSLEALKTDTYEADIKSVKPYHFGFLDEYRSQCPILMVIDQGNDERLVYDSTHTLFAFDVDLWGYSSKTNADDLQAQYNAIVASIKQWIYTNPDLGSAVRDVQYVGSPGLFLDQQSKQALVQVQIRILYYCVNGSF